MRKAPVRRRVAVLVIVGAMAAAGLACEISSSYTIDCDVIADLVQRVRTVTDPERGPAGGQAAVELAYEMPRNEVIALPIDRLQLTIPVPDVLVDIDAVTFTGGNMTGGWRAEGREVTLVFRGDGVTTNTALIPVVRVEGTVDPAAPTGPLPWPAYRELVADSGGSRARCVPADPALVLNNAYIDGTAEPGWQPPGPVPPASSPNWPNTITTTTTTTSPPTTGPGTTSTSIRPDGRLVTAVDYGSADSHAAWTFTTSVEPDPVAPGGATTIRIDTAAPAELPGVSVTKVLTATVTYPLPDGVATIDDVRSTGGNLTGTWNLGGRRLELRYDTTPLWDEHVAPNLADLRYPTLTFTAHLAADATGAVAWPAPDTVGMDYLAAGGPGSGFVVDRGSDASIATIHVG